MKTGALIAASVEAGAILGRVAPEGRTGLRGYARDLGLAFQIADDLLDVEGDEEAAGKKLRKDAGRGQGDVPVAARPRPRARTGADAGRSGGRSTSTAIGAEADLLRAIARLSWSGIRVMAARIGVYPGTFDPITLGHMDIIRRGAKLVDRLVIGVTTNPSKSPMFTVEERMAMVEREVAGIGGDIQRRRRSIRC